MQEIIHFYKKQPLSRHISISISFILIITAILISIPLPILYDDVRKSQLQLPSSFFGSYNSYSLEEVGKWSKSLILAVLDSRNSWVSAVRNSLINPEIQKLNSTQNS